MRTEFLLELLTQRVLVARRGQTRPPELVGNEQDDQHAGRQKPTPMERNTRRTVIGGRLPRRPIWTPSGPGLGIVRPCSSRIARAELTAIRARQE